MASVASSGRLPWPARPVTASSSQANPLWAMQIAPSVGSNTMAAAGGTARVGSHSRRSASVPTLKSSSSLTKVSHTSPAGGAAISDSASASMMAALPFMS